MKPKIASNHALAQWLAAPQPAVFQLHDLRPRAAEIAARPLGGCVFLGNEMTPELADAARKAGCLIMPRAHHLLFDPYRAQLYDADSLFDAFDPANARESFERCLDWRVYTSFMSPITHKTLPADLDLVLMRRLHDASVSQALEDVLDPETQFRTVGIMGGHDLQREDPAYGQAARLALAFAKAGYVIVTGGGPGAMEAANLGAFCAGVDGSNEALERALARLARPSPLNPAWEWLLPAWQVWKEIGALPRTTEKCMSIGIPTWFYGHEPPNVFATHIAKYFENSVREEGILALALAGIVYIQGNAGTVQEIFQDACQNYYKTYADVRSPMILLGADYWNPVLGDEPQDPLSDKRKSVYPLLRKLAAEKGFEDLVFATDDLEAAVQFVREHPPRVPA